MCDEDTVNDNDQYRKNAGTLSRRQFNALTAGTALTMPTPKALREGIRLSATEKYTS